MLSIPLMLMAMIYSYVCYDILKVATVEKESLKHFEFCEHHT